MIGDAFRVYQIHVKSNASFIKGRAKPKKNPHLQTVQGLVGTSKEGCSLLVTICVCLMDEQQKNARVIKWEEKQQRRRRPYSMRACSFACEFCLFFCVMFKQQFAPPPPPCPPPAPRLLPQSSTGLLPCSCCCRSLASGPC